MAQKDWVTLCDLWRLLKIRCVKGAGLVPAAIDDSELNYSQEFDGLHFPLEEFWLFINTVFPCPHPRFSPTPVGESHTRGTQ